MTHGDTDLHIQQFKVTLFFRKCKNGYYEHRNRHQYKEYNYE